MIPLIEREIVEKNKWINEKEMLDMFAIAESTPGVIAINTATFVGYKILGFWGSFFATIGVALPSFIIITLISFFFIEHMDNKIIDYAFEGVRVGVVVLIINAGLKLFKSIEKNRVNVSIVLIVFMISLFTNISAVLIIVGGLIFGVVYNIIINKNKVEDNL